MPPGDKIAASILIDQQVIQINTFTPKEEVVRQIEGPLTPDDDAVWARFTGVNQNDQDVDVVLKRDGIKGYIISPIVRSAIARPQVGKGVIQ